MRSIDACRFALRSMLQVSIEVTRPSFQLDVDVELPLHGATAVIGPNGSGKTTLLRALIGLERVVGRIELNGACWLDSQSRKCMPVHKRPVGYVSQTPVLLPHLSVEKNLRYAEYFSRRKRAPTEFTQIEEVVASLDLTHLMNRKPSHLSGGETSRVALAQALVCHPSVLLLDEPLASVDVDRKAELLPYLKSAMNEFKIPMLFVSHSLAEVASLCEYTLALRQGKVEQHGSTETVLQTLNTSEIVGESNIGAVVHGSVVEHDSGYQLTKVAVGPHSIAVPNGEDVEPGTEVRIRIRARDVSLATAKPSQISIRNVLQGTVSTIEQDLNSPYANVQIRCGDEVILSQVTRASISDLNLSPGKNVYALVKSVTMEL